MPRNRRIRLRRNRPQRNRAGRKITQISTGIPSVSKRVSGNPPVINESSALTVKVAFEVSITIDTKAQPFVVSVGTTPFDINEIKVSIANSGDKCTFYLDLDEIFQAAHVRAYGSAIDVTTVSGASTEAALCSVVFYGPMGAQSIRMGVDFGPGMPGAVASDAGTSASRAVTKVVSPRLYWDRLHNVKQGDAAVGLWIYGFNPLGNHVGAGANIYSCAGRVDCTVQIRRSWYSANTASAHSAKRHTDMFMS